MFANTFVNPDWIRRVLSDGQITLANASGALEAAGHTGLGPVQDGLNTMAVASGVIGDIDRELRDINAACTALRRSRGFRNRSEPVLNTLNELTRLEGKLNFLRDAASFMEAKAAFSLEVYPSEQFTGKSFA